MDELKLTVTRYNVAALLGWAGLLTGLVGAAMLYFAPSMPRFAFLVVGMICSGITVTFSGPVRSVSTKTIKAERGNIS